MESTTPRAPLAKHLIVISYDAFSEDNWEMAGRLSNLSKLIKHGAHSNRL
jgi:predicted AlkP superfamily pyrophosphatase or phosphodiesterase